MNQAYFDFLFNIARIGVVAWVLLVFFPRWRGTRWIIDEGVFPFYLAVLYTLALVPLAIKMPDLILVDFGNVNEVRRLFADPNMAVVFWLHILAFDQVVGMLIYHDNMENRYIPLWVQSVLLTAVLFVGPLAMLLYLLLRFPKKRVRDRERLRGTAARPGAPAPSPAAATV